ncbi:glycosyltransferase family 2 protein [Clostridium aminobutyricum]|uniref:Glycosyltransferase n=1 Tax=Clostridium aminobutyricum TaxID=33953 RepID=A0A939IJX6_CLOAM|nr:glycosyltransferase family 2 protein [Clostridium aminobutyricum]MBN7774043.1 glycosyltransferase [Clostridium aminobutyricum]
MESLIGKYVTYPEASIQGGLRTKSIFKSSIENQPLVTIITVVYNRRKKLKRAIESVLGQSYQNIEYILIDGGSTDGTLEVIKEYEDKIDYYISQEDKGIYNAMNKGLQLARGEYIGIVNSDDYFDINAVKCSIEKILENGADYSGALSQYVDIKGRPTMLLPLSHFDERAIFSIQPCGHATMFVSRKCFEAIGLYDEKYRIVADFKMQLLLIKEGFKHCTVNQVIHYFETDGVSANNTKLNVQELVQLINEQNPNVSFQEAETVIDLAWGFPIHRNQLVHLKSLMRRDYFTERQKVYLAEALIEKIHWQFQHQVWIDGREIGQSDLELGPLEKKIQEEKKGGENLQDNLYPVSEEDKDINLISQIKNDCMHTNYKKSFSKRIRYITKQFIPLGLLILYWRIRNKYK